MRVLIEGGTPLKGQVAVPADKSITHRALMLGAIAAGEGAVRARSPGADNHSTRAVLEQLGARIHEAREGDVVTWQAHGVGLRGLRATDAPLDCGNSGTTVRLLAGILAGAGCAVTLTGDASLRRRPMGRICRPLRELGAAIEGVRDGDRELLPVRVGAGALRGGRYESAIASAQVKSAVLLAGLTAGVAVEVMEPVLSRDHTERMLRGRGVPVHSGQANGRAVARLEPVHALGARDITVPGDVSSAAFWLCAGLLVPQSELELVGVGVNPSRTGVLDVLAALGARVSVSAERDEGGEPVADLRVNAQALRAPAEYRIDGAIIPRLIDELVVLTPLLACVQGPSVVADAAELRVKESDRIAQTCALLEAFGLHAQPRTDGFVLVGGGQPSPARVDVSSDHRIALTAAVLALAAPGESVLEGFDIADVSYPGFLAAAQAVGAKVRLRTD